MKKKPLQMPAATPQASPHLRPPTSPAPLLDPKNDFVFKKLFASAPELLAALINAVRSDEAPVQVVQVPNPHITPAELTGKFIVLDLLARDDAGSHFNIEMQVRRFNTYSPRSTYYLANTLTGQLKGGQDYDQLKPAIGIHLLDFDLFEEPAQQQQAVWCFEMRDRWQPAVRLGRELQLNIIEMRKADRLGGVQPGLAAWLTFFEHWQEETTMTQIAYAPVQQALERLKDFSADEETRIQAFVRERALRDEISERRSERAKGKIEGKIEGEVEGRQKEAVNILQRLLRRRFGDLPEASLARLQAASLEQLEQWTDAVLDAPSLSVVFASH
ncbi:MAG: Rpn family recombination-promoting nuclease/putative transposase [Rhodoferax sp.]|nr:Rpn family recombination-promoting nuclease/putative transposase [Rhodoferax sp.]